MTPRRVGLAIGLVAALGIAAATLIPGKVAATAGNYAPRCRICGPMSGVDVVGNVLLFAPLGLGLAVAGFARRRTVQLGGLASIAIELLQFTIIPGRDTSVVDVAANTLGTFAGFVVGAHWRTLVFPDRRASRMLALTSGAAHVALAMVVSWALGPGLPDGSWYLERGIGTRLKPAGRVLDARASAEPMVGDTMTNVPTVRRELLAGRSIVVTAVIAPGPNQATSFIQILDTSLDNIVTIDRHRDDAAFYSRMRASDLGLQHIQVKMAGFFAASAGDTVTLTGARVGPRLEIAGERNGRRSSNALLLTPGLGWAFFLPTGAELERPIPIADVTWTALLLLPFGYWAGRAARMSAVPGRWHLTRIGVAATSIGVVPWLFAIGPSHWWEWTAGFAALLIGHVVGGRTADGSSD